MSFYFIRKDADEKEREKVTTARSFVKKQCVVVTFSLDERAYSRYNLFVSARRRGQMTKWKNFLNYIDSSVSGIFKTKDLESAGFPRAYIQRLVKSGRLCRVSRGVYVCDDVWDDEYYLLQRRYGRGIFSHETSLYFWGFSDRVPFPYTMTFPKGYNSSALANEDVIVKRAKSEIYSLGATETRSPYGNLIRLYDLERSLCDVVRGSRGDWQIIVPAMRRYAAYREKNVPKLTRYAEVLRVEPKITRFMETLL